MSIVPNVNIDKSKYKKSNKYIETREKETPVYASQNFIPPPTLTKAELEVWEWLVGIFRETINCRVSDADVHLMEEYCRAKVASNEAHERILKNPNYYVIVPLGKDRNGDIKTTAKPNPDYKIRTDSVKLVDKLWRELGLSPVARSRIGIGAANAKSDLDVFKKLMERTDD